MPIYTVQQGDCLTSIAKQEGIKLEKIWNHSQNAALKQKRKDPNILLPGDRLFIPDRQLRDSDCSTDQRHTFQVEGMQANFRFRLLRNDKPRADINYTLILGGQQLSGTTDHDGWIVQKIPPDAAEALLVLAPDEQYTINLGCLDPFDELSGIQNRLRNLGFYGGAADGQVSEELTAALRMFQKSVGLEETGDPDPQTRDQLKLEHGS